MKIVLLVMSIIICFLIYLVIYFWLDRNFYRDVSKLWSECSEKISALSEKSNNDWAELCSKHNKDCIDICYKNSMEWAKAYAELQEENKRLKNLLAKREVYKNVK